MNIKGTARYGKSGNSGCREYGDKKAIRVRSWRGYHHCLAAGVCSLVLACAMPLMAAEQETVDDPLLPRAVAIEDDEAAIVGMDDYDDPLEPFNRTIFTFNDVVYRFALIPLADTYTVLPQDARDGVSRVFLNLREPLNLLNNTAQGHFGKAGKNILRFVTNSIIGIGGIFDPAEHWFGIEPEVQGFNDTFQAYGITSGPYLVLPFLGGTDIRGGVGMVLTSTFHPVRHVTDEPGTTAILVFDNFQQVAPQATSYRDLRNASDDPYVYFRNQYLQGVARDKAFPLADEVNASDE